MIKTTLIALLLAAVCELPSIAQDTTYLNSNWKETTADKAAYFRIKIKRDTGWQLTDYFRSGKIQMTGSYSDESCNISQGEFIWYDDKGAINRRCSYVQGKAEGSETYYYNNGHKKVTGTNNAGEQDGEWIGYYPSGRLSGKASYEKGKQVSATFFHEDGSPDKTVTEFMKEASYPGGQPKFLRFLMKTLRYPEIAIKNNIQGTAVILFKVSKEGTISDIKVVESVDKSLDEEALRVVSLTHQWEPAIIGGIASDSYHKQPIVFRLAN
jgi:protein TonB